MINITTTRARVKIAVALVSACLLPLSAFADSRDFFKLVNEGVALESQGKLEEALDKFKQAFAANPSNRIAQKDLTATYMNLGAKNWGQPANAIKFIHNGLLIEPNVSHGQEMLDNVVGMLGRDPKDFGERVALGDQCLKDGDPVGAIVEYRAAAAIKKDDTTLKAKMAEAKSQCHDPVLLPLFSEVATEAAPPAITEASETGSNNASSQTANAGSNSGATANSNSKSSSSSQDNKLMNLEEARQYFLAMVNRDRAANGLKPVELDDTANKAAQVHSDEMAEKLFNAHWHTDGSLPPQRYTRVGGMDYVAENSHGTLPQLGWKESKHPDQLFSPQQMADEENVYFDEKPPDDGHRRNILKPEHTDVGLGITRVKLVYNDSEPGNESDAIVSSQEFINKYGNYTASANQLKRGQIYTLSGEVDPSVVTEAMQVLREDIPKPIPLDVLRSSAYWRGYTLPNERVLSVYPAAYSHTAQASLNVDGSRFKCEITPASDWKSGLYYFILFAKRPGAASFPISIRALELK